MYYMKAINGEYVKRSGGVLSVSEYIYNFFFNLRLKSSDIYLKKHSKYTTKNRSNLNFLTSCLYLMLGLSH